MTFRLTNKLPNQSREEEKIDVKRKYFFILEGEKTEHIYINEVVNNIKQDAIADVYVLERIKGTHSNQYKITVSIKEYMDKNSQLSPEIKEKLTELSTDYEEENLTEEQLLEKIKGILGELTDSFITDHNRNVIEQIRVLNELNSYVEDFDRICLILDRDYRSFKDYQYDEVLEICEQQNFHLGISNPNFEFYLLLHINDAKHYNKIDLLENIRKTSKKKFVEYELNEALKTIGGSYQKNKYNAKIFIDRFDEFLSNIGHYEINNISLKNNLGSSVHKIIENLL
ncbi:RloB domain-containing protein [Lysinibacillus fusiformis]|uniref:RloB domain-containing protein n=1 Tax=Lysinibacillus fusiformis TaxID=28031 RepID=UPI00088046D0|nr:RloB domain-containing protein [Lysinibacillus fusiformis]SCX52111.1 RloB-like protein [Lysinibacillus fusiformis]SDB27682.1 RloB-like protein [Lysinibacillus fusiformis]SFI21818.1 RloB-like protein [Lysinibacillus fusiformis]SFS82059.1 RloB-like protein [Lysinibacillus fusiformis]